MNYSTKLTSQGTVTVPINIRKKYNLKSGDTLIFQDDGNITIKPRKLKTFAELRAINAQYIQRPLTPYKNGDGWTAYIKEKYGKK